MKKLFSVFVLFSLAWPVFAVTNGPSRSYEQLKKSLGFSQFYQNENPGRRMKIGILDSNNRRAAELKQIIHSFMSDDNHAPQWNADVGLYNSVDDIIKNKIEIVLSPDVWSPDEINRITRNGIIWINAVCDRGTYHNSAITVGASEYPNTYADVFVPSLGQGPAVSAAIATAGFGLLKTMEPRMTRKDLLDLVNRGGGSGGLSLQQLGFGPTGPGCFYDVYFNPPPYQIGEAIRIGGTPVQTTAGIRVMVPFDPITVCQGMRRVYANDMIVVLPWGGYGIYPRYSYIPEGAVEIFQRPLEAGLCRSNGIGDRNFYIPPMEFDDDPDIPEPAPNPRPNRSL